MKNFYRFYNIDFTTSGVQIISSPEGETSESFATSQENVKESALITWHDPQCAWGFLPLSQNAEKHGSMEQLLGRAALNEFSFQAAFPSGIQALTWDFLQSGSPQGVPIHHEAGRQLLVQRTPAPLGVSFPKNTWEHRPPQVNEGLSWNSRESHCNG